MKRRDFIHGSSLSLALGMLPISLAVREALADDTVTVHATAMEAWIEEAIATRALEGTLQLSRFVEPIYFLTAPISWRPNPRQAALLPSIAVPRGFVTDLASIPPNFFEFLRPDGEYAHAAIIHDFLYWSQQHSRSDADAIFKAAMEDLEVDPPIVVTLYNAVRVFGGHAWRMNTQLRRNGEKRILRRFPADPRTRWRDYKKDSEAFAD